VRVELIVLGLVAGLSFLSYALWKRSRGEELEQALLAERAGAPTLAEEPTLQTLRPGDVVSHLATDYLVEGVITLDDDGELTRIYRVADGARVRWLAVRPGDGEPLLLDEVRDLASMSMEVSAPAELRHGGADYRLSARACARVRLVGTLGAGRAGDRAWLYDYAGLGPKRILALAWKERTDTFLGESVGASMLEILPGA
jgi:hypothetical protein